MKDVFVTTSNVHQYNQLCAELEDPSSQIGPSMALVSGRAGRGKTEAARHYAVNSDAVYIRTMPTWTPFDCLRAIAFDLAGIKPGRTSACIDLIEAEMAKKRRLILLDEADLVPLIIIETMRGLNERAGCPIVLIGEEGMRDRVASRRRIVSRICRHVEFGPVTQADLALYYAEALDLELSPSVAAKLYRHCQGDWRPVVKAAKDVERAVRASGLSGVTEELAREVTK